MSPHRLIAAEVDYRSIVNSLGAPLFVIDSNLNVTFANVAAYMMLGDNEEDVVGRPFFDIGTGQWHEQQLRPLLSAVIPYDIEINAFEIEQDFPEIGRRVLNLSARRLLRDGRTTNLCLVTIEDVTTENIEQRETESELDRVHQMIDEIHHRVKNNIASITAMIRLESRRVSAGDARDAFERIAGRIDSLSTLYELLAVGENSGKVELTSYIGRLCASIERMATAPAPGWAIEVTGDPMDVNVDDALSVGAIIHELVANAVKYAFHGTQDIGRISVECIYRPGRVILDVSDNGNGIDPNYTDPKSTGLGMRLVEMYLGNLEGTMSRDSDESGTRYKISLPIKAEVPESALEPETVSPPDNLTRLPARVRGTFTGRD